MNRMPQANAVATGRSTHVLTVQGQVRLSRVAVSLDVEHPIGPVNISTPDQMQRRLRAPIGAIEVERILTDLAVVADQPLLVDISQVALPTGVAGEIKHVPDKRTPQIGPLMKRCPRRLVIQVL